MTRATGNPTRHCSTRGILKCPSSLPSPPPTPDWLHARARSRPGPIGGRTPVQSAWFDKYLWTDVVRVDSKFRIQTYGLNEHFWTHRYKINATGGREEEGGGGEARREEGATREGKSSHILYSHFSFALICFVCIHSHYSRRFQISHPYISNKGLCCCWLFLFYVVFLCCASYVFHFFISLIINVIWSHFYFSEIEFFIIHCK